MLPREGHCGTPSPLGFFLSLGDENNSQLLVWLCIVNVVVGSVLPLMEGLVWIFWTRCVCVCMCNNTNQLNQFATCIVHISEEMLQLKNYVITYISEFDGANISCLCYPYVIKCFYTCYNHLQRSWLSNSFSPQRSSRMKDTACRAIRTQHSCL